MACHDLCLATNNDQNAAVAEDEDEENRDVEREEIPDVVEKLGRFVFKDAVRGAPSFYQSGG